MVKERKAQTGATNLSARSGTSISLSSQNSASTGKLTREWAHTMIAPEDYKKKSEEPSANQLKLMATWKPVEMYKRDFSTTHKEDYRLHEDEPTHKMAAAKSTEQIAAENLEKRDQEAAVDTMCGLVRTSYGTVASMLRSFHKKPADNVSLYEFDKYLGRNNLQEYLSEDQRKLIFNFVDPKGAEKGYVPVKDFLKKVEEREFLSTEHGSGGDGHHTKIRDFLALQLALHKQRTLEPGETSPSGKVRPNNIDPEFEKLKQTKNGVHNEAERLRQVLGMKTFGLQEAEDIHPEEFGEALHHAFHKQSVNVMDEKYARFLHHSHLKLANVAFYGYRATELDRLKHRSVVIDQTLLKPELKEKYDNLRSTFVRGSMAVSQSLSVLPSMASQQFSKKSLDNINRRSSSQDDSGNDYNNNSNYYQDQQQEATMMNSPSFSLSSPSPLSPIRQSQQSMQVRPSPLSKVQSAQQQEEGEEAVKNMTLSLPVPIQQKQHRYSANHVTNNEDESTATVTTNTFDEGHVTNQTLHRIGLKGQSESMDQLSVSSPEPSRVSSHYQSVSNDSQADVLSQQNKPAKHQAYLGLLQDNDPLASSNDSAADVVSSSSKKKSLSKLLNRQHATADHVSDFYAEIISADSSIGRSRNPQKLMRIEKTELGMQRAQDMLGHSKSQVQLSGDGGSHLGLGYGTRYSEEHEPSPHHGMSERLEGEPSIYASAASLAYPPLIYEPSQPVRREGLSMASLEAAKREHRRQQRQARKAANLDVTRSRLEFEALDKDVRAMHRDQGRIEDAIRYKTSILLGDLMAFKQQPLQRMAKRQNIDLAEKMWSGQGPSLLKSGEVVSKDEALGTTYRSSFDSAVLRKSDVLGIQEVQPAWVAKTMSHRHSSHAHAHSHQEQPAAQTENK